MSVLSTTRHSTLVATIAGALATILGLMVLVGWYTHTTLLIQVVPSLVPMQFNTALGFLACGISLITLVHGHTKLALASATAAGTIGLVTLAEYAFDVSLGIDQLVFEHYITVETSHPGRMAPNTAACFVLTAAATLAVTRSRRTGQLFWIIGLLGVLLLSLGSVAFIGYLTGAHSTYEWGQLTHMAAHTSLGFVVLSLGFVAIALRQSVLWSTSSGSVSPFDPLRERRRIVVTSITIMVLVSAALGVTITRELYSASLESQRARLVELVQSQGRMIEAVANFSTPGGTNMAASERATVLSQIVAVHQRTPGFGKSGEFTLAVREDDEIIFIVKPMHAGPSFVKRLDLESALDEPMQLALEEKSGTIIGTDYRGHRVVAAYTPIASHGLGLVAKMDLSEIQEPFIRSIVLTIAMALVIVVMGAGATVISIDPLARRAEIQARGLHQANIELKHEAEEREQLVELLEGIYQTYPDMQFVLEADGTILRFSTFDEADLHVPSESFVGSRMTDVLPSEVASVWMDALRAARDKQGVQTIGYSLPLGAEVRDYEGRLMLMPDGRIVAIARDITQRRQAEERIHLLNISLEQRVAERTVELKTANQELEAFAYSVSHDLKSPLRAIDGFSAMLEERHEASLSEDGRRLLQQVRESSQKMARLIDDVLAISRIGRSEMVMSEVDMKELVQHVFSDLMRQEGDRVVEFSVAELPTITGDLGFLQQLWMNLLENALKFTAGQDPARIEVDILDEPDHHVFRVRDNGAGFDMSYVDKLFGVFQRLHYEDEFPGTGIGLAIVQRIVGRHGGEIWAEGEVGVGATFCFRMPHDEMSP